MENNAELYSLPLHPPNGAYPSAWLEQYDSTPTLLPQWPESDRMALVVVIDAGPEPDAEEAFVIVSPDQLRQVSDPGHGLGRLFFRIPKLYLLRDPEICPGLTAESFWSQEP